MLSHKKSKSAYQIIKPMLNTKTLDQCIKMLETIKSKPTTIRCHKKKLKIVKKMFPNLIVKSY